MSCRGNNSDEHWKLNSEKPWKILMNNSSKSKRFDERPIKEIGSFKNSRFGTNKSKSQIYSGDQLLTWEFDPGSGWTLAACLTHASRTKHFSWFSSGMILLWLSGGRVSNAWVTCLIQGDNSWKRLLMPHKRTVSHDTVWKTPVVWDGPASD